MIDDPVLARKVVEIKVKGRIRRALNEFTLKYSGQEVIIRVDGREMARPRILALSEGDAIQLTLDDSIPEVAEGIEKLLRGNAKFEISTD